MNRIAVVLTLLAVERHCTDQHEDDCLLDVLVSPVVRRDARDEVGERVVLTRELVDGLAVLLDVDPTPRLVNDDLLRPIQKRSAVAC
jgi:hypothetical protein